MVYPHLDREGRISFDDLEDMKIEIIPRFGDWNLKKLAQSLNELNDIKLIILYPNDSKMAMEFTRFEEFQVGLRRDREAESKINSAPKDISYYFDPLSLILKEKFNEGMKSKEGRKLKEGRNDSPQSSAKLHILNVFNTFHKISYSFEKKKWENISLEDLKGWKEAYPAVNIELELKAMGEWLLSNPLKKKTNYRRFIVNWLKREQDKGGTIRGEKSKFESFEERRKREIKEDYERLEEKLKKEKQDGKD
jgi:hypothetical protein